MKKTIILFILIISIHISIFANNEMVYIDKENIDPKYHRITCNHIEPNRYTTITVESAFEQGYRRCPDCNPPMSDFEYNERLKRAKELRESVGLYTENVTTNKNSDNRVVYITNNSAKFHSAGCDEMKSTPHSITVTDAKNRGYAPCKVCNPYDLAGTSSIETTNETGRINPLVCIIIASIIILIIYLIHNDNKYYKKNKKI